MHKFPQAIGHDDLAFQMAAQVGNIGDGPDSAAFQRDYFDSLNCIHMAMHDAGCVFCEELTAPKADELCAALGAFEAAIAGGSIEARDLAARSVAGLVRAHAMASGRKVLARYQDRAWHEVAGVHYAEQAQRMAGGSIRGGVL